MRLSTIASLLALALSPSAALARQAQPYVISGVGPQSYATQPAPQGQSANGGYGGGLIELLVTGQSPGGNSALYNRPQDGAAPVAAPARQAAYRPDAIDPPSYAGDVAPALRRQDVAYDGPQKPGEIVIDTRRKFLFLIEPGDRALRYGIGVGREGFAWKGVEKISRKAEWPSWTPPADMRLRQPSLPVSMAGGLDNPLGARALYLGSTLYRIHGTNEPSTIGKNMSSGCIRMMNADVEDLYERVNVGTTVVVL